MIQLSDVSSLLLHEASCIENKVRKSLFADKNFLAFVFLFMFSSTQDSL